MSRRILVLWFPRLAAERALRLRPDAAGRPLAVVRTEGNRRRLGAVSAEASAAGLAPGMALADALALCPELITVPADPAREAATLAALARWAGRFSPWVAEAPPDALRLDITGCAHLWGGERGLVEEVGRQTAALGLTVLYGIADTLGAAWAMALQAAGQAGAGRRGAGARRSGSAIDQEARATRARAAPHAVRGGAAADRDAPGPSGIRGGIVPPGRLRETLGPLPLEVLRLPAEARDGLLALGIRTVADLAALPRGALARRFGPEVGRRLDELFGVSAEPLSPRLPPPRLAVRATLAEPILDRAAVMAVLERLVAALCDRLRRAGQGARELRLELEHVDGKRSWHRIACARPTTEPEMLLSLAALGLEKIETGFGIDRLRLAAVHTEPVHPDRHRGALAALAEALPAAGPGAVRAGAAAQTRLADLLGRLGARIGLEALTRWHPADSHIPEKAASVMAAAWSEPALGWPMPARPRPLVLIPPEPLTPLEPPIAPAATAPAEGAEERPPRRFRWRRREFRVVAAEGPERIAPEWWLDDPAWRSGPRDYWRVDTAEGARLWLFRARGAAVPGGWFCHGDFG